MQQDQDIMKQNQDQRVKPMMQGENQNQQRNQPQKCPRCESLNTKFCYYNNYSLSQPRYFCKTCRRYWTHGGTLRNVPVGGGCRKGKRPKTSSSSSATNSSSSSSEISKSQTSASSTQNMVMASTNSVSSLGLGLRAKESMNLVSTTPGISSLGTYGYSSGGGGFLMNSLAAIQSFNNQPAQSFTPNHQSMNLVGENFGGGISNLSLLHGFNAAVPSFGSQHIQQQGQFYHIGNRDNKSSTGDHHPFYATATSHHQQQQQNWHQAAGLMSSSQTNPTTLSDTALWSVSTSTTTGNSYSSNTANAGGSFALNPTAQWHHDLPGYGPPP